MAPPTAPGFAADADGATAHMTIYGYCCACRLIHLCWSGGVYVLVEDSAEAVASSHVEGNDPGPPGDWFRRGAERRSLVRAEDSSSQVKRLLGLVARRVVLNLLERVRDPTEHVQPNRRSSSRRVEQYDY